jgi:MFS family permease
VALVVLALVARAGGAGRGAYTIDVFPPDERVESQAWMRAALNAGFTLGALLSGLALAFDSDRLIRLVPLFTAALLALNAAYVLRLPDAAHDGPRTPAKGPLGVRASALRNRGFLAVSACSGVLDTNQVLLNIVIPLWLVQETDAPHVLLAWLFGTNTVMVVLLQVAAARGVDSVGRALRAARISSACFVLSCLVVLLTHDTVGWVTIVLVWLAHVTVTGAELFQSAAHWGFLSELSDPERLGEYQGAASLGGTLGSVWAPAAYTYLAVTWGASGWLLIAAVVVAATLALPSAARAAERFLARDSAPDPQPA